MGGGAEVGGRDQVFSKTPLYSRDGNDGFLGSESRCEDEALDGDEEKLRERDDVAAPGKLPATNSLESSRTAR